MAYDAASETETSTDCGKRPREVPSMRQARLWRDGFSSAHLFRPARLFSDSSSLITLPCKLLFPIRNQAPLLVALRGSPKPIILRSERRARGLASQPQYTVDHLYVRKDFYFAFCTFSFIFFCFRPLALYSVVPSFTLAHLPFRTPHFLHPRYLYIYRSALDHISVNLSFIRALHPRRHRRRAGL